MLRTANKKILQNTGLVFLGIFLGLLILETGLRIGGFAILSLQRNSGISDANDSNTARILTLGESTTADYQYGQNSWPQELEIILNNRSSNTKFKVYNEGIPGITTNVLLSNLEGNLDEYGPNIVIAMMGINDRGVFVENNDTFALENNFFENLRIYKLSARILEGLNYKISESDKELTFKEKEAALIKLWEDSPEDTKNFFDLTQLYTANEKWKELEEISIRQATTQTNNSIWAQNLIIAYEKQGKYKEAEQLLIKLLRIDANNRYIYLRLGYNYHWQNKTAEAILMLLEYLHRQPSYDEGTMNLLGNLYLETNNYEMAYSVYTLILTVDPRKTDQVFYLGDLYSKTGKANDTINLFKETIEKNPDNFAAYSELALYYFGNNKTEDGNEYFNKIMKVNMNPSQLIPGYNKLGYRFQERGYTEYANRLFDKSLELRERNHNPTTQKNYRKLYEETNKRGIKLIVMQYPTLDADNLKRMFKSDEHVIFVSNEDNFKAALNESNYGEYFVDYFAATFGYGKFGHATTKGNRLIAEGVADEVLGMAEN